jgi:hypothetical protein
MVDEIKIFPDVPVPIMKQRVIEAAKRTKKYGMTAYTIAAWGKLKFEGDYMKMAVGRVFASTGGVGGTVRVSPEGNGSAVQVKWEALSPDAKYGQVTTYFWNNLAQVVQPGGLKLGPRTTAFKVATGLVLVLALYILAALLINIAVLASIDITDPAGPLLAGSIAVDVVILIWAIVAAVLVLRRRDWVRVIVFPWIIIFWGSISFLGMLFINALDFVSLPETILSLAAAAVSLVLLYRCKAEFA